MRAIHSGSRNIALAENSPNTAARPMPTRPATRAPCGSPRPIALPTRTVIAPAMPSGTMKAIEAKLIATWWAAMGSAPSVPISSAAETNRLPSKKMVTPIGRPTRNRPRISRRLGRLKRW